MVRFYQYGRPNKTLFEMNDKVFLSDIELLLKAFGVDSYKLFVNDPKKRLLDYADSTIRRTDEHAVSVLINLGESINRFRSMELKDFDYILDFRNGQIPSEFNQKRFWFINNPDGTMRWLFQPGRLKSVLDFYNTATIRSQLLATSIRAAHTFKLERFASSGKLNVYHKQSLPLEKKLIEVEHDGLSIFTGTAGYDRKAVVAVQKEERTTHFVKVPLNKRSIKALNRERATLEFLNSKEFKTISVPQIVGGENSEILIQTNERDSSMTNVGDLGSEHISALLELSEVSKSKMSIRDSKFWQQLPVSSLDPNEKKGQESYGRILQLLSKVKIGIEPSQTVTWSLSHSDFTPWNMLVGDAGLYIYDWELSKNQAPALFDLFHFHFQNGIISKQTGIKSILKSIYQDCNRSSIREFTDMNGVNILLHLRLYLLHTVSYYLRNFQKQKELSVEHRNQLIVWEQALQYCIAASESSSQRQSFVPAFYEMLRSKEHALLKFLPGSFNNLPESSDLDIAIRQTELPSLIDFCKNNVLVERSKVIRKSFMTTIELFFFDGSFLSIDLIYQLKRKGRQMMEIDLLLKSARPNMFGIKVPANQYDMEYALVFYTLNGASIPYKYFDHFQGAVRQEKQETFDYLNGKYQLGFESYSQLFPYTNRKQKSVVDVIKKRPFSSIKRRLTDWISYVSDSIKDIITARGFVVTLSGVDGVGKSTIVSEVRKEIQTRYRKEVVLLRHRPGILPILSSAIYGSKEKAEQVASVTKPRMGTNRSVLSSAVRFAYYYLDYLIGQLYVNFRYVARNKVVLYDRYYFDFIADSRRSNIDLNSGIIKRLYAFVHKPKLNILLWAEPEEVFKRKQELEPNVVKQLTQDYKQLFQDYSERYRNGIYRSLKNEKIEDTVNAIMSEFSRVA